MNVSSINEVEAAIKRFSTVVWASSGYQLASERDGVIDAGWVKFGIQQTSLA
jgi:hypothetical protein